MNEVITFDQLLDATSSSPAINLDEYPEEVDVYTLDSQREYKRFAAIFVYQLRRELMNLGVPAVGLKTLYLDRPAQEKFSEQINRFIAACFAFSSRGKMGSILDIDSMRWDANNLAETLFPFLVRKIEGVRKRILLN